MNIILISQSLITLLFGIGLIWLSTPHHAISFVLGSGLILLDFVLFWFAGKLIFAKKLVALAIGIIVFKYAILGIIVFKLFKLSWLNILWFCLGIASFSLAAIAYAVKETLIEGKDNGGI